MMTINIFSLLNLVPASVSAADDFYEELLFCFDAGCASW
jgi:hypothetical protein